MRPVSQSYHAPAVTGNEGAADGVRLGPDDLRVVADDAAALAAAGILGDLGNIQVGDLLDREQTLALKM